ncbi:hypothetical protein ABC255_09730 [Neobacillus sp. 3P2-tot-E-2]|uniref:hypothetical protein n=1 Tax=Neobacillus sp. 3P2-tot-E-2 TaxID=3132212 RepID=UPI0039A2F28C
MTVLIQIHYITSDNKILRRGSFQLKGRSKEETALDFWRWIKKEHPYECEIEKIICEGEDITDKVKELEKAHLD